jgi:tetratricopeptide (TPR) repeat protein
MGANKPCYNNKQMNNKDNDLQMEVQNSLRYLERLIKNRELKLARAVANKLISSDLANPIFYRKLIQIEEMDGRTHIVLMIYAELVKLSNDPLDILGWYSRLYKMRDYEVLSEHFWSAILCSARFSPDTTHNREIWMLALKSLLHQKQTSRFGQIFPMMDPCDHPSPQYYLLSVVWMFLENNYEACFSQLRKALDQFPNQKNLRLLLALLLYVKGDFQQAEPIFWELLHQGSVLALSYLLEISENKKELIHILTSESFFDKLG